MGTAAKFVSSVCSLLTSLMVLSFIPPAVAPPQAQMWCQEEFPFCPPPPPPPPPPIPSPAPSPLPYPSDMGPFEFFSLANYGLLGLPDSLESSESFPPPPGPSSPPNLGTGPVGKFVGPGGKIGLELDPFRSSLEVTKAFTIDGQGEMAMNIRLIADSKSTCQGAEMRLRVVYRYITVDASKKKANAFKIKGVSPDVSGFARINFADDCLDKDISSSDRGRLIPRPIGNSYVVMKTNKDDQVVIKFVLLLQWDKNYPLTLEFKVLKPNAPGLVSSLPFPPSVCPKDRTADPFVLFSACPQIYYRLVNNKKGICMTLKIGGKKVTFDCECTHLEVVKPVIPGYGDIVALGVIRVNSDACEDMYGAFFFVWHKVTKVSELQIELADEPVITTGSSAPLSTAESSAKKRTSKKEKKEAEKAMEEAIKESDDVAAALEKISNGGALTGSEVEEIAESLSGPNSEQSLVLPFGFGAFIALDDCAELGITSGDIIPLIATFKGGKGLTIKSTSKGIEAKGWVSGGAANGDISFGLECVACRDIPQRRRLTDSEVEEGEAEASCPVPSPSPPHNTP